MADRTIRTFLRVEAADAKRELRSVASEVDKTSAAFDASGKRIETASGRMVRSARVNAAEWRTVGTTLATIGTIGIAALGASAAAAVQWESAWTGVLKTVDGTATELTKLEDGLRRMATELPASHAEIAGVAEAAGQLGVGVADIESFTKVMIDLGETTNLSAQEAATGLARFANVMGTAQSDVSRLGSTIVGLGNNFATTEREIVDMAQRLASAARTVGVSEADVLGLAAAMSSVGIEAEAGGSAVSRVMIAISKAVDTGGEKLGAFAQAAGMSSERFAQAWRDDSADALLSVVGGLAKMTDAGEGAFGMLDDLGLKDVRVTNAMLSMANAADMTRGALDLANDAWDENTALLEEANKRYETTEARISTAKNALNDAAIDIGSHLLPVLSGLAEGVADVAKWFGNLPDPVQRSIGGIGGFASVLALGVGGVALLVPRLAETYDAFRRISEISPRVATGIGRIGKAAGIAAASAGIVYLTDALTNLADGAGRAIPSIEDVVQAILDADGRLPDDMFSSIKNVESVTEALDAITGQGGVGRQLDLWASKLDDIFGTSMISSVSDSKAGFEAWGQALARLVEMGHADKAAEGLELLYGQVDQTKYSIGDLKAAMPAYTEALTAAENASKITAEETQVLAGSVSTAADAMENYLTLIGKTAEEFSDWQVAAANANATFVDLGGAYDSVIEKNRQVAESSAEATKSSKDSWEDFYDGTSVSIDDFIAKLQEQVDAQDAWEQNLLDLAAGGASTALVEGLTDLGEQGAPIVAMIAEASPEELAEIERLFRERGSWATSAFANELSEATFGAIPVEADTTPAIAEIDELMRMYNGQSIYLPVRPKAVPTPNQYDEPLGPPAPSGSLFNPPASPIWGNSGPSLPLSQQAQTNTFGTRTQGGSPTILREHTVEQTSVFVDKLVTSDVEDFTQQSTALRRGAAVAGMRAV